MSVKSIVCSIVNLQQAISSLEEMLHDQQTLLLKALDVTIADADPDMPVEMAPDKTYKLYELVPSTLNKSVAKQITDKF